MLYREDPPSGTLRGMIQAIIPREIDQNNRAALRCGLKSPEILLPHILKLLKLRKTEKRKWTAAF